jgi:hypothetical protein
VPTDVVVDTSIDSRTYWYAYAYVPEVPDGTILPAENTFTEQLLNTKGKKSSQRLMKLCGKRTNSAREDCWPWENVIDDEDRQYLQFKKETGRGRKDFDSLNVDYDTVSSLDLAREK